ncbi:MAG: SLBB domain-containing protein [Acidobacteria bacterium]|nr:SLBB domain-containing protein [Acidobacteriota bacterium]
MHTSLPLRLRRAMTAGLGLLLWPLLLAQTSAVQPADATVHIFGLVANPGPYAWSQSLTVREAVALAGGYVEDGSKNGLEIQRMVAGKLVSSVATEDDSVEADDVVMVRGVPFRPGVTRGASLLLGRCAACAS